MAAAVAISGGQSSHPTTPIRKPTMTSDRIVALNILMRALEEPLKTYNRHLRKAWRTETDSPENLTAREDGDKALLEIGKVVRSCAAQNEDPDGCDLNSSKHLARAEPAVSAPMPPTDQVTPATFVLWLDASDGSVPTSDGVQWPDGWVTIRHRHYGHTTTHHSPEAACEAAHGTQGRIVWTAPADRGAVLLWAAEHLLARCPHLGKPDALRKCTCPAAEELIRLASQEPGAAGYASAREAVLRRLAAEAQKREREREPQCTCGGPSTSTTLPSGITYEEHKRTCAAMTTDGADAQPDNENGHEQADGPTPKPPLTKLEQAALEARAALGALCCDLEDPGSNALGALYLLSQATTGLTTQSDDAARALARRDAQTMRRCADFVRDAYEEDWAEDVAATLEHGAERTERGETTHTRAGEIPGPST